MTVHPHVHGELAEITRDALREYGSSPRAWGTRICSRRDNQVTGSSPRAWGTQNLKGTGLLWQRFIPTCMGNSRAGFTRVLEMTVHPHVHGELRITGPGSYSADGSSPRAWGTHNIQPFLFLWSRFIPTCMGNSNKADTRCLRRPVHPHVHGELTCSSSMKIIFIGSSPRAWGTLFRRGSKFMILRFIPTCMGNSHIFQVLQWS